MRALLLIAAVAAGCAPGADLRPIGQVAPFTLADQDGREVTLADLQGRVAVVAFFFTRCTTICPRMMASLQELDLDLPASSGLLRAGISIDPEFDRPPVLKAFAERHGLPAEGFLLLSGEREEIRRLSLDSFKLAFGEEMSPAGDILHSSRFVLVDRSGQVRGYFDGLDPAVRPALLRAIRALLAERTEG